MRGVYINSDRQLQNCISMKTSVEAWFQGELSYIGILEAYSDSIIMFNGGAYFLRGNCKLKASLYLNKRNKRRGML
jgi:hypothetical protein